MPTPVAPRLHDLLAPLAGGSLPVHLTAWDGSAAGADPAQAVVRGRLHSLGRDRAAISHHYDLSNHFYELILDAQMAYSCAYVTQPGADLTTGRESEAYPLEQAQFDKLELVCTKLGLDDRPDQRVVDVGCGWGSLTLHAAREHGARVVAVTISREQQAFVQRRAQEQGVADRVEVRLQDYREVPETDFDAVASLEMVGEKVTRVWELYLAAGAWTFAAGRMGVDQLLLRRPS